MCVVSSLLVVSFSPLSIYLCRLFDMIVLHILVLQIFAAVSCASAFFAGHFRSAVLYVFLFVTRGWQCHPRFGSWSSFCFPVHNWLAITSHPLGERLV